MAAVPRSELRRWALERAICPDSYACVLSRLVPPLGRCDVLALPAGFRVRVRLLPAPAGSHTLDAVVERAVDARFELVGAGATTFGSGAGRAGGGVQWKAWLGDDTTASSVHSAITVDVGVTGEPTIPRATTGTRVFMGDDAGWVHITVEVTEGLTG